MGKARANKRHAVHLDVIVGGKSLLLEGREAWALKNLIERGERGVTPIDNPAPRWSHYIYKLRSYGITIETRHEPHGGAFSGTHARYVLHSPVRVVRAA